MNLDTLHRTGINYGDALALRRISMTLHRWHEAECNGDIQREETTDKPCLVSPLSGRRWRIPDRETGALKRLARIMKNYPTLSYYVQTDPRGAALYILRPGDVPEGADADAYYSRGIAVYK